MAAEFRHGVRKRYDDLDRQRRTTLAKITEAETQGDEGTDGAALRDAVPHLQAGLADLPGAIQRAIPDFRR
jgi:site-specific DNA recombinase